VKWVKLWDAAIVVGSLLPSLLWGVAFGNLVRGVDAATVAKGPYHVLVAALNPYSLLAGLTTLGLFALHGALFLGLKTSGELRGRAIGLAARLSVPTLLIAGAWAVWTQLSYGKTWTWIPVAIAAAALVGVVMAAQQSREGLGFLLTTLVTAMAVVLIFGSLFPNVLPIRGAESLTIDNASSTRNTLVVMTWVAVLMTPVVLVYQSWTYWVFRRRLSTDDIPAPTGLGSLRVPAASKAGRAG
jgi:cytochrome d ubiquinol oxidase subunit II